MIRTHSTVAAYETQGFPLRPASAAELLATVQQLFRALTLASPAERPFLERDIRTYADRYRAVAREDWTPC